MAVVRGSEARSDVRPRRKDEEDRRQCWLCEVEDGEDEEAEMEDGDRKSVV